MNKPYTVILSHYNSLRDCPYCWKKFVSQLWNEYEAAQKYSNYKEYFEICCAKENIIKYETGSATFRSQHDYLIFVLKYS